MTTSPWFFLRAAITGGAFATIAFVIAGQVVTYGLWLALMIVGWWMVAGTIVNLAAAASVAWVNHAALNDEAPLSVRSEFVGV